MPFLASHPTTWNCRRAYKWRLHFLTSKTTATSSSCFLSSFRPLSLSIAYGIIQSIHSFIIGKFLNERSSQHTYMNFSKICSACCASAPKISMPFLILVIQSDILTDHQNLYMYRMYGKYICTHMNTEKAAATATATAAQKDRDRERNMNSTHTHTEHILNYNNDTMVHYIVWR